MRRPLTRPQGLGSALLWDLLTFEKLMTNQVIHLIYWAGLAWLVAALALSLLLTRRVTGVVHV